MLVCHAASSGSGDRSAAVGGQHWPVAEGLSAIEVGKEVSKHAEHAAGRRQELISIAEAVLLAMVTITAAWSGYSAAKWSTKSSLELARASAARAEATRAFEQSQTLRAQDAANFNAWFAAYLAGRKNEERVAENHFRPEYDVAFRAWLATKPFTNPHAPKAPQYMAQYQPTGYAESSALDAQAALNYAAGEHAASTGDDYIRVTVVLASVLFLVGLSSHFPLHGVRVGLVALGAALLCFAAVEILRLPGPPT
jgi:hypothetical protein